MPSVCTIYGINRAKLVEFYMWPSGLKKGGLKCMRQTDLCALGHPKKQMPGKIY